MEINIPVKGYSNRCSEYLNDEVIKTLVHDLFNDDSRLNRASEQDLLTRANSFLSQINEAKVALFSDLKTTYIKKFPELASAGLTPEEYSHVVLAIGDASSLTRLDDLLKRHSKIQQDFIKKSNIENFKSNNHLNGDFFDESSNFSTQSVLPPRIMLALALPAATTTGIPLNQTEILKCLFEAKVILKTDELLKKILKGLESRMERVAPNLTALVGSHLASLLISECGSLFGLASCPAGNILVLGRSNRGGSDLLGLSQASSNPHAGLIQKCDLVERTPPEYRKQAMRMLSAKIALVARYDLSKVQRSVPDDSKPGTQNLTANSYGSDLRHEVIRKLEKLAEPAAHNLVKPIPPPNLAPSKKRGGRRARKLKEILGLTEVRRAANRVAMDRAEEEVLIGDTVIGMGDLGSEHASRKIGRKPPLVGDDKLREHIKRQSQRAYASIGFQNFNSGISNNNSNGQTENFLSINKAIPSSLNESRPNLTVSTGQIISLSNQDGAKAIQDQNGAMSRYFGTNLSFKKPN